MYLPFPLIRRMMQTQDLIAWNTSSKREIVYAAIVSSNYCAPAHIDEDCLINSSNQS